MPVQEVYVLPLQLGHTLAVSFLGRIPEIKIRPGDAVKISKMHNLAHIVDISLLIGLHGFPFLTRTVAASA